MYLSPSIGLDLCPFQGGGSVVVDLLFNVLPIVCGISLFYAFLCVHFSFAIILKRKRELVVCYYCLTDVLYYKCTLALPHSALGWSAVFDCGFS